MSLSLCHAPGSEPWWGPDPDEDEDDFLTLHCPEELDQAMQAWGDKVAAIQETTHDANVFALEVARLIYLPDSWQPSPACRQLTTRLDIYQGERTAGPIEETRDKLRRKVAKAI